MKSSAKITWKSMMRAMMFLLLVLMPLSYSLAQLNAQINPQPAPGPGEVVENLTHQVKLLVPILRFTEDLDAPAIRLLGTLTMKTRDSVNSQAFNVNRETVTALQLLLLWHKNNGSVLKRVTTEKTAEHIAQLSALATQLANWTGLGEKLFSKVTAFVYEQIHDLLVMYGKEVNKSVELERTLIDLNAAIGVLMGKGRAHGDNYKVLVLGNEMFNRIHELQKKLSKLLKSESTGQLIQDISGWNDYYGKIMECHLEGTLE